MTQAEIESLAFRLLYRHGLYNWGWKFKFHRYKNIVGLCNYSKKRISGSKFMLIGAPFERVHNTLLHEIAHALCPGSRHDDVWRKKFIDIGGNGEIKCSYSKPTFTAKCGSCGHYYRCHRRVKKICSKCFPKKIEKLSWERVKYS